MPRRARRSNHSGNPSGNPGNQSGNPGGNPGNRNPAYDRGDPRRGEPEVLYSPELCLALPKLESPSPVTGEMVHVDGSLLEGGGQILRISSAVSCLLGIPLTITKIRAGRSKPGLSAQHLAGLRLIRAICEGELTGDAIRSEEISLTPGRVRAGRFTVDTKTAGSVALLLQSALPCLLFAPEPSTLVLKGGTNADFAPPIDYVGQVFSHYASMFGVKFDLEVVRRGFNPRGGGEVTVQTHPLASLTPIDLTLRGDPVSGIVSVLGVTGKRCIHPASSMLSRRFGDLALSTEVLEEGCTEGWGLSVVLRTSGGCVLGAAAVGSPRGSPDRLATDTTERLIKDWDEGGCCDSFMQDQVVVFAALARGPSRIRTGPLTLHTRTAIHVCEQLTGARFTVTKDEGCELGQQSYLIECTGIGLDNPYQLQ